jgi:Flp pilus assembly protein TadD
MNYDNVIINKSSTSLNIIGVEKADNGDILAALKFFSEAIKLNPKDPNAYFNRATLLVKIGDIQAARADFKNAQKLSS